MKFSHAIRRIHTYLALALLPWVLMYAISALAITRPDPRDRLYGDDASLWTTRSEHPYERPVPDDLSRDEMRGLGKLILDDFGIEITSTYGAYSLRKKRLTVYASDFWNFTRLVYDIDERKIKIQDKQFRWLHFLTRLHSRGGFAHGTVLNYFWGIVVDLVVIGFLLWATTGIYMWWQLRNARNWGFVALVAGLFSFTIFLLEL